MEPNIQHQQQRARLEQRGPAPIADLAAYREARARRDQIAPAADTLHEARQAWARLVVDLHYGRGMPAAEALERAGAWPEAEAEAEL